MSLFYPGNIQPYKLCRTWKLAKGKFRPKLQQYVDAADPKVVKEASLKAFAFCEAGQVAKALAALTTPLKGVGPATGALERMTAV